MSHYTDAMYLHEHTDWTSFTWDAAAITSLLGRARFAQGLLLGKMADVGLALEESAEIDALTGEIVASSRIEGVVLDADKVRSSVSRQLGLAVSGEVADTRAVDGSVAIMLEATKGSDEPLSRERLEQWHAALFPEGYSGLTKVRVARYRDRPMQVVSEAIGRERVHFAAPAAELVPALMDSFIAWFNEDDTDPLLKASLAHLRFLTIHPFDDGNGRIARALTEMLLARSDRASRRFYSMAGQILADREAYYTVLERTQKGDRDVTAWLVWFLQTLEKSITQSDEALRLVLERSRFWHALEGVPLNNRQRMMLGRLKSSFEGKLTASKWGKMCKVSPDTALRDINDLMDKGVLAKEGAGGRSTSYVLVDLPGASFLHD